MYITKQTIDALLLTILIIINLFPKKLESLIQISFSLYSVIFLANDYYVIVKITQNISIFVLKKYCHPGGKILNYHPVGLPAT